tara:strand:+ start:17 stop:238 length:222 start_codon:yes stop_codon:yes gene_type:complete
MKSKKNTDKLKILISNFLKKKKLKLDESNIFLNLDSLETVELLSLIEKKLKIKTNRMDILNKAKVSITYFKFK